MDNEIQVFQNDNFGEIRTVNYKGEPWFVAKDVCNILGIQNVTQAMQQLEDFERSMFNIGRQGDANIISESGFYTLVLRSRKTIAKPFRVWVTSIVLPQIRKTGQYIAPVQPVQTPASLMQRSLALINDLTQALEEEQQKVAIMAPKAEFCDGFLQNPVSYTATQIAEHYGWTAQKLNAFLKENGVQYKQSGQWHLKAKYKPYGYVTYDMLEIASKSGANPTLFKQEMKWTPKGVAWIEKSLRLRGIVPVTPFNVMSSLDDEKNF